MSRVVADRAMQGLGSELQFAGALAFVGAADALEEKRGGGEMVSVRKTLAFLRVGLFVAASHPTWAAEAFRLVTKWGRYVTLVGSVIFAKPLQGKGERS